MTAALTAVSSGTSELSFASSSTCKRGAAFTLWQGLKVRERAEFDSAEIGRLPAGKSVVVLERQQLPEGALRVRVAADDEMTPLDELLPLGWVRLAWSRLA